MKSFSVGNILQEAISDPNVKIFQETYFGDEFQKFTHHQTHLYDIEEFTADPEAEELISLQALLGLGCHSILDIGAGSGRISKWLIDQGGDVLACETDPACIELCQQKGITKYHQGQIASIKDRFDGCILIGGGIPLLNPSLDPLKEVHTFLSLIREKIKDGGYFLIDVCNYTHPLFNAINGYKVATIKFFTQDKQSNNEYYIYPSQHQIAAIMHDLGFENAFHVVKTYSAGDPDVYQHYSIWRKIDNEKRQSLSSEYAIRWN